MKILLINPPENLDLKLNIVSTQYPINLGYLAAVLISNGFEVELWDYVVEHFNGDEFIARLAAFQPDLVGLTSMTNTITSVAQISKLIKYNFPNISIAVGGTHSTALPERTMEEISEVDYIIQGEGEISFLELCQNIANKLYVGSILGLVYRSDAGVVVNSKRPLIDDIDSIPFPARDLVNLNLYNRSHTSRGISRNFFKVSELITSRGCPNHCIFCAGHTSYGYGVRFRSVENVLREVKECIKKYSSKHFSILDDTFTLIPQRTLEICQGFKKLGVTWDCNTRVNNVTKELLGIMKDSGCRKVSFGIEASSERMLKEIKKGITLEQVRNAVRWAKEEKIDIIEGTFILGSHPSETIDEVNGTIKLMRELDLDFVFYGIIVPFPGTEIFQIMKDRGYIIDDMDWSKFIFLGDEPPPWRTDNFTSRDLLRLQKKVLRKFYLRPKYLIRRLLKIRNFEEIKYYSKGAIDFFKKFFI
jgi:radical SAM superfamily enzyme YgiQ (UPF0313 family)